MTKDLEVYVLASDSSLQLAAAIAAEKGYLQTDANNRGQQFISALVASRHRAFEPIVLWLSSKENNENIQAACNSVSRNIPCLRPTCEHNRVSSWDASVYTSVIECARPESVTFAVSWYCKHFFLM
jgi:hypothetical protein